MLGFTFIAQSVKAQIDACKLVKSTYHVGLDYGKLDPAKYLPEYRAKLKAAGIDVILAELKKQLKVYADANGY